MVWNKNKLSISFCYFFHIFFLYFPRSDPKVKKIYFDCENMSSLKFKYLKSHIFSLGFPISTSNRTQIVYHYANWPEIFSMNSLISNAMHLHTDVCIWYYSFYFPIHLNKNFEFFYALIGSLELETRNRFHKKCHHLVLGVWKLERKKMT